jgi:formylglycine-generating enzyme required for sulfatase activity
LLVLVIGRAVNVFGSKFRVWGFESAVKIGGHVVKIGTRAWLVGASLAAFLTVQAAWAQEKALPDKLSVDLGGGVKMDFVLIRAGTFRMGSDRGDPDELPIHQVTITKPFYMDVYEVTQAQWKALMGNNPSHFKGDDLPVESVSWTDCQSFLAKLKEKLPRGMTCRLPTEAEWEYACRAGSTTEYCDGDGEGFLYRGAWYCRNSEGKTHPVGQKRPNAWGLYDVHGNVWEWCSDWYGEYDAASVSDPKGPSSGTHRVMRGASWGDSWPITRTAYRGMDDPNRRFDIYGLRVMVAISE